MKKRILKVNCAKNLNKYRGGRCDKIILNNYDYLSKESLDHFMTYIFIPKVILSKGKLKNKIVKGKSWFND